MTGFGPKLELTECKIFGNRIDVGDDDEDFFFVVLDILLMVKSLIGKGVLIVKEVIGFCRSEMGGLLIGEGNLLL